MADAEQPKALPESPENSGKGCAPFGPFRLECDPVERIAQLRVLRTLVHVYWGLPNLERALKDAETDPVCRAWALAFIDALPTLHRRRILATFAYIHKPLYGSARTQPKKGTANAYVD